MVAHPDDMEYGAAAAVARWTRQGKWIGYVLVTDGEAGIQSMPPEQAGPIRREEQVASCREVGVTDVEFLGLARRSSSSRGSSSAADSPPRSVGIDPTWCVSINHRDSWGGTELEPRRPPRGRPGLLDAVRDAANPWMFHRSSATVWGGVRFVAFNASPSPTHAVDTTATFDAGVRSLACHRTYLENLGGDVASPATRLRGAAESSGELLGVELAATFEVVG